MFCSYSLLEAKRVLMSQWASERTRGGRAFKLHFNDARKAYFNGAPSRNLYVRMPPEMGVGKNVVAKLTRCMYGCRDSGSIWEST